MARIPRRIPFNLATMPFRPGGALARNAADTMDSVAPMAAKAGDAMADAAGEGLRGISDAVSPAVGKGISTVGNGIGTAVSEIPAIGPIVGGAIKEAADIAGQAAPAVMRAGAVPVAKVGGRMLGSAVTQGLRGVAGLTGAADPMGPASRAAMNFRSLSATTPDAGLDAPPPPPNLDAPPDMNRMGDFEPAFMNQELKQGSDAALEAVRKMYAEPPAAPIRPEFKPAGGALDEQGPPGVAGTQEYLRRRGPRVRTSFNGI